MRRLPLLLLALLMLLSGCYTLDDIDNNRRYPDRRTPDARYPDSRYPDSRDGRRSSAYYNRVDRDARSFVQNLDRRLRLNNSDERNIDRLLSQRTYQLLDRTRRADHDRVYPFPRRYNNNRNNAVDNWWRATDSQIERYLDRNQRDEYRRITRRNNDRYDRDRRDRDDRYKRDQRDNRDRGKGKKKGHYKNKKKNKKNKKYDDDDDD